MGRNKMSINNYSQRVPKVSLAKINPALFAFVILVEVTINSNIAFSETSNPPNHSIEQVIAIAKEYVNKKQIVTVHYFIGNVKYYESSSNSEDPYWRVEYSHLSDTKAKPLVIFVYQDGSVKHLFER